MSHYLFLNNESLCKNYIFSDLNEYMFVRFDVPTAMTIISTVFWDVRPCSLVESNRCLGGTRRLRLQDRSISRTALCLLRDCCCAYIFHCKHGGIKLIRNLGKLLPDYTESDPRIE